MCESSRFAAPPSPLASASVLLLASAATTAWQALFSAPPSPGAGLLLRQKPAHSAAS
eukprot:CAMPEP_0119069362 /NCGR_PEP_ID=MMETSP1178-20130426/14680_1 /TAXON_ID=33656 /ORGANISM="unid sp, Strain CCMP2000" /LENGTH=56 /DNA_ID=CAMNT_0007051119 /DNA_START=324 /DNA_END=494 /DNA_ORIENTATION=+